METSLRRAVLALQIVVAAAYAQTPLSERIEVSVVNVDVSVTGADGQPVRGLTGDDFEVFEDGRRQSITNFYAVEGTTTPAPPGEPAAPRLQQDSRFRRRVLVLLDVFHTTRNRRAIALGSLEKLIDDSFTSGDYDWSVAILGRGVTTILPLTTDKQQIHAALDRMVRLGERHVPALTADAPLGAVNAGAASRVVNDDIIDRAMSFEETNRLIAAGFTARAIIDAVRGFAGTPGRKILFLLTGDLGMNDLQLTADNFGGNGGGVFQRPLTPGLARRARDFTDLRTSIVREANASGAAMYIFNIEGLQPMGDLGAAPKPITDTSAVFWLAKDTGGRLVTGNDATSAVRQFDSTSGNYYSLGYRPPHPGDGKYHQIEVRLKDVKRASLEYRSGYSSASGDTQLARAMESPLAMTLLPQSLPVTLTTGAAEPDRRRLAIPISVKVPFSSLQFLPVEKGVGASVRVFVSVFDDIGTRIFAGSYPLTVRLPAADPQGVMVYKNVVVVGKGQAGRIVAAVRDETTENVGVAEINITTR